MTYNSTWTETHPDLFAALTDHTCARITQILTAGHIEGWEPTREEISDLIAYELEYITEHEYTRRGDARIYAAYGTTRPTT
jgi:hypothetical protein